jgi:undecaprenyl-diphosphatase
MDQAITQWINSLAGSSALLDSVMVTATKVGVPLLVALVVAQWWSRIDWRHVRHTCIAAGLSFLIGLGLNQIILLFVHRVRPYDAGVSHLIISKSPDWSFSSDHATASIAIVAAFALHGLPRRTLLFGLPALLVCWSRIFVGTHYLTDASAAASRASSRPCWYGDSTGRDRGSIASPRGSCDMAKCRR